MDHIELYDPLAISDIITNCSALPSRDYNASNDRPGIQTIPVVASNDTPHLPGAMTIPSGKPRQITEKEWDDLKDTLHMHYIQENMKVGDILKMMREKHNILLT